MNKMTRRLFAITGAATLGALLTGCGSTLTTTASTHGAALKGNVHGGQQPVKHTLIQLYAASTSGYGALADQRLTTTVKTGNDGSFSIGGDYTCPSPDAEMYLTSTGGDPGAGGDNANLAMMAALGPCSTLTPDRFIWINEQTTVASVWALSQFMTDISHVGTSPSNIIGLQNAFAAVDKLVNTVNGTPTGPKLPANATLSIAEMNSLSNILAACVNTTGGNPGDSNPCGQLFQLSVSSGDTVSAALAIAQHPGRNVSDLWALPQADAPFQTALPTAPTDWTIALNYAPGSFSHPQGVAIDGSGNVWLANSNSNSVTKLDSSGVVVSSYTGGSLSVPFAIAIDNSGSAWVTNSGGNSLIQISGMTMTNFGSLGLSNPQYLAFDTGGNIWIANAGNNSLGEVSGTGTSLLSGITTGINGPSGIAVNPR